MQLARNRAFTNYMRRCFTNLQRCDLVIMDVRHLVIGQGGTRLVVDLKASIEHEPVQQLLEKVSFQGPLDQA